MTTNCVDSNMKYRKKPVVIEASQWFKNGDHPLDYSRTHDGLENGELRQFSPEERKANNWEGDIVRYYRHPEVSGETACKHCNKTMHNHGWVDTLEGGHIVCPGDWIITGVEGEHYPCKPHIFEQTYESTEQQPAPAVQREPVAWIRKWSLDGEKPSKERNKSGRMALPMKFKLHEVTRNRYLPDDVALYTAPQPAEREIPGSYPVSGQIFFRGASNEWVLELTGSVNGTTFTARHTQPADIRPEDVAGLPALYETTPDVSALVEALESAKNLIANHSGEVLPDEYAGDQIEQIDAALAAWRQRR